MSGYGGMERILTDKMNFLTCNTQHDITLLLLWHDDSPLPYPLNPGIRIIRLNIPYIKGAIGMPLLILKYNNIIKKLAPDVTVLSWVLGAVLGAFAHKVGKTIYESHQAKHTMRHQWIIRIAERRVDDVVTLTPEDASEHTGARHVHIIPNLTQIHTNTPTDYSLKHCVWTGRLNHVKDLPRLLKLWQQLSTIHPGWTLDIYGDGEEYESIQKLVQRYDISSSIVMHGCCDDVTTAYMSGSIFILTSKFEGFGISMIEAMSCGLPVVAFDCDYGPRNIINDRENGFLVPYDDDGMMIKCMHQLMSDYNLRKSMGLQAYRDSIKYQPNSIMSQWITLFDSLCQS